MKPLMLSAVTASFFLILASAIYGSAAILTSAWVAMVFYGLLGAGLAVSILSRRPIP
jgi:hypothetical protein